MKSGDDEPPGAMQMLMLRGGRFSRGWQNVTIAYRAGYQVRNEVAIAPSVAPLLIATNQPYGAYACDCGVTYANGQALDLVAANPSQGQYALDGAGGYWFSSADGGQICCSTMAMCRLISPIARWNGLRTAIVTAKGSP